MIELVGVPIAILLLAAACGGDDDSSVADGATADVGAEQDEAPDPQGSETSEEGSVAGLAVVTINEEFAFPIVFCSTVQGQVSGNTRLDDDEVWIDFGLPPEDWETNETFSNTTPDMSVSDTRQEPHLQWRARYDASVAGSLDYTIEGSRVTGSAIFTSVAPTAGLDFESETVEGTFDIDCGG